MSRPLRIEFPGGLYHVTSRGDRREDIFLDDEDRQHWLKLLGHVCDRFDWRCHAYCLMGNHFHIVIETIQGNLSAGMRQLNGFYSQWHNRVHGRVGHVFQGRFHAVIVQRDAYLLELARYVVLNPVRAGLGAAPEQWRWSSYNASIGRARAPHWLQTSSLLAQFGIDPADARRAFIKHVQASDRVSGEVWDGLKSQIYLGDDGFAQELGQRARQHDGVLEIPRAQRAVGVPTLAHFRAMSTDRRAAMASAYATGCYNLRQIADAFGVHYATVSRAIRSTGR
jgi:REP element-mobilizing transposase RayT